MLHLENVMIIVLHFHYLYLIRESVAAHIFVSKKMAPFSQQIF